MSRKDKVRHTADEKPATKAEVADVLDAVKLKGETISDVYDRFREPTKQTETMSEDSDVLFSLWDFAGQSVYYITHQVFLASRVIYILVTDLTKSLNDTLPVDNGDEWAVSEFLSFWMNSIHTHARPGSDVQLQQLDGSDKRVAAPPVIVLGTKKDLLRHNIRNIDEEANKRLQEIVEHLRKHAPKAVNAHIVGKIAVDNRLTKGLFWKTHADPAVDYLQEMIQKLAMKYFFCGEVQAKWILFEISLRKQPKQKMSLDEVKALGRQFEMEEAEIMEALEFYHDIGEMLHFKAIPELNETVIVDVAWLVNLFKILITQDISGKEKLSYTPKIRSLLEELHREGRLHEELVDHLLEVHHREEDKVILLSIMEMYDILCKMPTEPEEKCVYYLPSLLQKDTDGEEDKISLIQHPSYCPLYYHFKGNFLPEGLFYRLIIRCMRYWLVQDDHVALSKRKARILLERYQFHLTLCKEGSDVKLQVLIPSRGETAILTQPKDVEDVRIVVENELEHLINTYFPGSNYQASVKCTSPSHPTGELLPGAEDINDRCLPISRGERTVFCKSCVLRSEYPELDNWYFTKGERASSTCASDEAMGRAVAEGERISSTGTSDEAEGRAGLDPLSVFFYTLQEELTDGDTRHMINLLTPKQISRRDADTLNTPFDVFNDLRQKGFLSENDLELLKKVFRKMRKATLVSHIDEYLRDGGH